MFVWSSADIVNGTRRIDSKTFGPFLEITADSSGSASCVTAGLFFLKLSRLFVWLCLNLSVRHWAFCAEFELPLKTLWTDIPEKCQESQSTWVPVLFPISQRTRTSRNWWLTWWRNFWCQFCTIVTLMPETSLVSLSTLASSFHC